MLMKCYRNREKEMERVRERKKAIEERGGG